MKLTLHVVDKNSYKYNFPTQIFGRCYNQEFLEFFKRNKKLFKPIVSTNLEPCTRIYNGADNIPYAITNINNSCAELRCFALDVLEDFEINKDYRTFFYHNLALAVADMRNSFIIIKNVSYENNKLYIHLYKIPMVYDGIEYKYTGDIKGM